MPRSRAAWMAAMESTSSCGPQANAQPLPPMAHAPMPIGVIFRSLLPSRFSCIVSTHFQQFPLQYPFSGQVKLILPRMDVRALGQGDLHQRLVPLFAKYHADGRFLSPHSHVAVEVVHVHLHLPEILMRKLAEFQ